MEKGNQSKEANNLPGLSHEPVMGTGGEQPACPTASQPPANRDTQVLMTPWCSAQLTSAQALRKKCRFQN